MGNFNGHICVNQFGHCECDECREDRKIQLKNDELKNASPTRKDDNVVNLPLIKKSDNLN